MCTGVLLQRSAKDCNGLQLWSYPNHIPQNHQKPEKTRNVSDLPVVYVELKMLVAIQQFGSLEHPHEEHLRSFGLQQMVRPGKIHTLQVSSSPVGDFYGNNLIEWCSLDFKQALVPSCTIFLLDRKYLL